MKIKVCIANYGTHQLWCLDKMLAEFSTYKKYNLDITEYTTERPDRKHYWYSKAAGMDLPYKCRVHMAEQINDFDLFLYNENDHLITEDNIDAWLEHNSTLSFPECSGFYRYEVKDGKKILLDLNPAYGRLVKNIYDLNFSLRNEHQGCYLLTRDQLKFCIDSGEFLHNTGRGPYGCLEQGATDPYNRCKLKKMLPKDAVMFNRLGIYHLPVKYSLKNEWIKKGISPEEFINNLEKYNV